MKCKRNCKKLGKMIFNYNNTILVFIGCLVLSNLFLTLRFLNNQSNNCPNINVSAIGKVTEIKVLPSAIKKCSKVILQDLHNVSNFAFSNINFKLGRWDNQRLFKIFDFSINSVLLYEDSKVCLATQSSVERLYFLVQVARNWNGPISLAVFAAGDDEFHILQIYVTYLRSCYDYIKNSVTFHLAVPKDKLPKTSFNKTNQILNIINNCDAPEATLKKLLKLRTTDTFRYRLKKAYPQNHMRNLARKGCVSSNVFLTDVDIIPNQNLAKQLDIFFETNQCNKLCAYVIPTYEIDFHVKFPNEKNELMRLVKKGLARPFHEKVFIYNQYATNFSRWQNEESETEDIHISHNVTNFEFLYEPFYVANEEKVVVPIHDERFLGYGFTRNSQVYEMFLAGYQFQVLAPAFTCHWGLQEKKHRPSWRELQNNVNRKKFEDFKREIAAKHSNSSKNLKSISKDNKNKINKFF